MWLNYFVTSESLRWNSDRYYDLQVGYFYPGVMRKKPQEGASHWTREANWVNLVALVFECRLRRRVKKLRFLHACICEVSIWGEPLVLWYLRLLYYIYIFFLSMYPQIPSIVLYPFAFTCHLYIKNSWKFYLLWSAAQNGGHFLLGYHLFGFTRKIYDRYFIGKGIPYWHIGKNMTELEGMFSLKWNLLLDVKQLGPFVEGPKMLV